MTDIIRAKVARILNSREIAITAGTSQGVEVGMLFDVLDQKGENICDPDTGEILGSIARPKVRVKVTQVQERIAVASTFKKEKINVGGSGIAIAEFGLVSRAFMPPKYITKYETLKTDEKTWEDLNEEMSYVKSGDPIVQVIIDLNETEING